MKAKKSEKQIRVKRTRNTYTADAGRITKDKSLTVQNEVPSIAQLLARHMQGETLKGRNGLFVDDADEEDVDAEKFRNLDLTEQEDVLAGMRAMTARLKALEREYEAEQKAKAEASKTSTDGA